MSSIPPIRPPAPMQINRLGPAMPPQMQMPANAYTFMNSPYNFQAQMLGAGNPGMGMYGYGNQLQNSPMMQRFLPETTRHAMTNNQPFPFGGYQTPWQANGLQATFDPAMLRQRFQGQQPPQQPTQDLSQLRQDYRQSLTPEQLALKGGENGNVDFRQSLTPEQIAQRQQIMQLRQGQQGPQGAQQPQQASGYGSYSASGYTPPGGAPQQPQQASGYGAAYGSSAQPYQSVPTWQSTQQRFNGVGSGMAGQMFGNRGMSQPQGWQMPYMPMMNLGMGARW